MYGALVLAAHFVPRPLIAGLVCPDGTRGGRVASRHALKVNF